MVCDTLLSNWLTNTYRNIENQQVLLIAINEFNDFQNIENLLKKHSILLSCHVANLNTLKSFTDLFKNSKGNLYINDKSPAKNFIFYVDNKSSTRIQYLLKICREHNKEILFVNANKAYDALHQIQNTVRNHNQEPIVLPSQSNFYLDVYNFNPVFLVTNQEFKEHLSSIIDHRSMFMRGLFIKSIYSDENIINKIHTDIELLKLTNLLTSNLAGHIYHLTFFKLEINPTEAGIYFRDGLGIKSKTFNRNSKKLKNIQNKPSKPFKAYDLSIDMKKQIKIDIASKLIRFIKSNPNKEFDSNSIAKITDLSIEEVEEIFDSYKR